MSSQKTFLLDQSVYVTESRNTSYRHIDELPIEKTLTDTLQIDLKGGFDNLVRYYRPYVHKIIQDIVYPDDIDDVIQETFLRAYRALKGYKPEKIKMLKFRPWLRVIAKNTAINRYSECRNHKEIFISLEMFETSNEQLLGDTSTDTENDGIINEEIRRALASIEEYLKTHLHQERNRQIWTQYLEKHSQQEIARSLGCSPDIVGYVIRTLQRYARETCKKIY